MGPSGVLDQSLALITLAISPPPTSQSSREAPFRSVISGHLSNASLAGMRVLGSGHRGLHHHLFSTRTGDDDERQIDALGAIDPKIKSCAALRESQDLKEEDSLPAAGGVSWFTDFC